VSRACSRFGLCHFEISDHFSGVAGSVGHLVATMDPTVGIDEVAVAHRVLGVLLVRSPGDLVRRPYRAIHIAQQMEGEALRFSEGQVLGRCVERSAEDDGIELFEALGAVTQALALLGSTRRRRFRVPPEQHPPAPKIVKMNDPAVFVRQFEVRCNRVQREHPASLAERSGAAGQPNERTRFSDAGSAGRAGRDDPEAEEEAVQFEQPRAAHWSPPQLPCRSPGERRPR
jgi:hypothetical protein